VTTRSDERVPRRVPEALWSLGHEPTTVDGQQGKTRVVNIGGSCVREEGLEAAKRDFFAVSLEAASRASTSPTPQQPCPIMLHGVPRPTPKPWYNRHVWPRKRLQVAARRPVVAPPPLDALEALLIGDWAHCMIGDWGLLCESG
jgi:hypothetical protein